MLKINGSKINIDYFPDGTLLIKNEYYTTVFLNTINWYFESNEELISLIFITREIQEKGGRLALHMPYIPNARQDRVKDKEDVFTLKYFSEIINSLNFEYVKVLDAHSNISLSLINKIKHITPEKYIKQVIEEINSKNLMLFYPDEGAMKRYSEMINKPYSFGIKKRDWATGSILGLDVIADQQNIKDKDILIIDDISSKGGTFYYSAKKLKELGVKNIYLYVTHCENAILEGKLINSSLLKQIYTTDSIFTKQNDMIKIIKLGDKF